MINLEGFRKNPLQTKNIVKTFKNMKLSSGFSHLLLAVGILVCQNFAFANTKTAISAAPLSQVLDKIGSRYQVIITYDSKLLADIRVNFDFIPGESLENAVNRALNKTDLKYRQLTDKYYIVYKKNQTDKSKLRKIKRKFEQIEKLENSENIDIKKNLSGSPKTNLQTIIKAAATLLNEKTLVGKVTDQNDQPLIGVNIRVKGTSIGTTTDADGNFSFAVPEDAETLVFSYIGFDNQEINIGDRTNFAVVLREATSQLDEVIVVGFGTQKKKFTTGSISKIKGEEIENSIQTTFDGALQGKVSGVQVITSNAMAGSPVTIRVRGTSSIQASSDPLYVVDGVPVVSGNFSKNNASNWRLATANESNALVQLNPADIESIEVLKDASATAIYGSRGSNGVVLITTKKGKQGKTKFNVGLQSGYSKETNRIEMLDGPTYLSLAKEAWTNSHLDNLADDNPNNDKVYDTANDYQKFWNTILPTGLSREKAETTSTDWIDHALQNGQFNELNFSASGGDKKTLFYIGGTYRDEQGIYAGNNFERYNARVNIDHNPTDYLSIGARTAFTVTDNDIIPIAWAGGLGTAQSTALPFWPIFNDDGTYFNAQSGNNVVAELENTEMNQKGTSILGNVYANLNFLKNFTLRSEFGINNVYNKEFYYRSAIIEPAAIATSVLSESRNWNTNNTLSYSLSSRRHALDVLVGMNATQNDFFANAIDGETFPNPSLKNPENAAVKTAAVNATQFSFLSYLSRINYRFSDKYLFTFSIRRDGSSRFGAGNRWGAFPAVSLGWIVSEEKFLRESSILTFLKLRLSYGITGNAEIGNFEYFGSFQSSNYADMPGIVVEEIDNPKLGWESTTQYDAGLDFGFLQGRIEGGIDFYFKETTNLLNVVDVSSLSGVQEVTNNIGSLENKGLDLSLTSRNLLGAFRWTTTLTLGYNVNKITSLGDRQFFPPRGLGGGAVSVGHPVGARYSVPWAGIATEDMMLLVTNPQTLTIEEIQAKGGDELFINQFGEITNFISPDDQVFLGNPNPKWMGGLSNSFSWKNLDLEVLFTFAAGHDLANDEQRYQFNGFGYGWNMWTSATERWQQSGDQTDMHRLTWAPERPGSSRYIHKADFLRLKNISLGYRFPEKLLRKFGLSSMRIYAQGNNLLTWTSYPGWDPEYNRDGAGNTGQGYSWLPAPQAKGVSIGLNATF